MPNKLVLLNTRMRRLARDKILYYRAYWYVTKNMSVVSTVPGVFNDVKVVKIM